MECQWVSLTVPSRWPASIVLEDTEDEAPKPLLLFLGGEGSVTRSNASHVQPWFGIIDPWHIVVSSELTPSTREILKSQNPAWRPAHGKVPLGGRRGGFHCPQGGLPGYRTNLTRNYRSWRTQRYSDTPDPCMIIYAYIEPQHHPDVYQYSIHGESGV